MKVRYMIMENNEYKKSVKVDAWITEPTYDLLCDIAFSLNKSISQFIRETLEEKIKEYFE